MTTNEKINVAQLISLIAGACGIIGFGWRIADTGYSIKENQDIMQKDISFVKEVQKSQGDDIKKAARDILENKNDTKDCHYQIEILCTKIKQTDCK